MSAADEFVRPFFLMLVGAFALGMAFLWVFLLLISHLRISFHWI